MRELEIRLHSVQEVLAFVTLATSRKFSIKVGNDHHQVNGKSFMEMFCLNLREPLTVSLECSEEEHRQFRLDADRFLAK